MKFYLSFLPKEQQAQWIAAWPGVRRWLVMHFCCFHVAAVCWWLIPSQEYPKDSRTAPAFNWMAQAEEALMAWKRDKVAQKAFFVDPLESYAFLSTLYQSWRMFAPNPINVQAWMAAYPVIGWRNLAANEKLPDGTPWPERRVPLYGDVEFTGYEGALEDRMQHAPLFYGYGFKISEGVLNHRNLDVARAIADFSLRRYERRNGKRPLGFHVLRLNAPILPRFDLPKEEREHLRSSVLFFHHY